MGLKPRLLSVATPFTRWLKSTEMDGCCVVDFGYSNQNQRGEEIVLCSGSFVVALSIKACSSLNLFSTRKKSELTFTALFVLTSVIIELGLYMTFRSRVLFRACLYVFSISSNNSWILIGNCGWNKMVWFYPQTTTAAPIIGASDKLCCIKKAMPLSAALPLRVAPMPSTGDRFVQKDLKSLNTNTYDFKCLAHNKYASCHSF